MVSVHGNGRGIGKAGVDFVCVPCFVDPGHDVIERELEPTGLVVGGVLRRRWFGRFGGWRVCRRGVRAALLLLCTGAGDAADQLAVQVIERGRGVLADGLLAGLPDGILLHTRELAFDDAFGLVLVVDAGEGKGDARALDQGLVAQHPLGVRLPRAVDWSEFPLEWLAVDFVQVLANHGRVRAVLSIDDGFHPFRALLVPVQFTGFDPVVELTEFDTVKVRVLVDDPRPAIDADHGNDAVLLVRIGEDFLDERVQVVLIRDDQQGSHLFIRWWGKAFALLERGCLQNIHELVGLNREFVRELLDETAAPALAASLYDFL